MSRIKTVIIFILFILTGNPAYPMLILKQEKKHSPAYLCIQKRKIKKDPLISPQQERDGFEHIITVGKVVIQNAGTITKSIQTAVTVGLFNVASQFVTGESWSERSRRHNERRGYDIDEPKYKEEREKEELEKYEKSIIEYDMPSSPETLKYDPEKGYYTNALGRIFHADRILMPIPKTSEPSNSVQVRIVDYENNPEDKAWLEDFAKSICPSGEYTIENISDEVDEQAQSATCNFSPNNPNNKKPKDPKDSHKLHENIEKFHDAAGHFIGEHVLEHKIHEYREHNHEKSEHNTLKDEPEIKSTHQKIPNYSSGKRLEHSKNAQEKAHPKEEKVTSEPWARQVSAEREKSEEKIESTPLKQESNVNSVKVYTSGSDTPTQSTTYMHRDPEYTKSDTKETNASRWAHDDYLYDGPSSSSNYSSSSNNSSHTFSGNYGASSLGCKLYKDEY